MILSFALFPVKAISASSGCGDTSESFYNTKVKEIFKAHCFACHASYVPLEKRFGAPPESNFDSYEYVVSKAVKISKRIENRSMPPGGADQIPDAEYQCILEWLKSHKQEQKTVKVKKNREVQSFNGGFSFKVKSFYEPFNIEELSQIMKQADLEKKQLRLVGSRHAWNSGIVSKDISISLQNLRRVEYRKEDQTVYVNSAVTINELRRVLIENERSLVGIPGYGWQSVGGVLSTGTHGFHKMFHDNVIEMTVVKPGGEILEITDEERLRFHRLALGSLGAIVGVRLKTIPYFQYKYTQSYPPKPELLDGLIEEVNSIGKDDFLSVYIYPFQRLTVKRFWKKIDKPEWKMVQPELTEVSWLEKKIIGPMMLFLKRRVKNLYIRVYKMALDPREGMEEVFITDKSLDSIDDPMPGNGDKTARNLGEFILNAELYGQVQNEISVPFSLFPKALDKIQAFFEEKRESGDFIYEDGIYTRFLRASNTAALAGNSLEDRVYMQFQYTDNDEKYISELADILIKDFKGMIHFGKRLSVDKADILKNYPSEDLSSFLEYRKTIDPNKIMVNEYFRKITGKRSLD